MDLIDEELRALGLEPRDRVALLLVPMAVVAWADGRADMRELDAIAERHCPPDAAADREGALPLTDNARTFLNRKLLYEKPDDDLTDLLLRLLGELLDRTSPDTAVRKRDQIAGMCLDVAKRSGGFLGLFGRVSAEEKEAIQELFRRLRLYEGSRAEEIQRAIEM